MHSADAGGGRSSLVRGRDTGDGGTCGLGGSTGGHCDLGDGSRGAASGDGVGLGCAGGHARGHGGGGYAWWAEGGGHCGDHLCVVISNPILPGLGTSETYGGHGARAVSNSDSLALGSSVVNTAVSQGRSLGAHSRQDRHDNRGGHGGVVVLPHGGSNRSVRRVRDVGHRVRSRRVRGRVRGLVGRGGSHVGGRSFVRRSRVGVHARGAHAVGVTSGHDTGDGNEAGEGSCLVVHFRKILLLRLIYYY